MAASVKIFGGAAINQPIQAVPLFEGGATSVTSYTWYTRDTIGGGTSTISGATLATFIPKLAQKNKYIGCDVEFNDASTASSNTLGPVNDAGASAAPAAPTRKSRRTYKVDTSKWHPSRRPKQEGE